MLWQSGQITHPSFVTSLAVSAAFFKPSHHFLHLFHSIPRLFARVRARSFKGTSNHLA